MRIDAHQHFWRYEPQEYAWIVERLAPLRCDFLPADLRPLLERHGLDGCVAVQARQSLEETDWLLELADEHPWIVGVVGWIDLCSADAAAHLARFQERARLVGLRHIAQDEPDDAFLLREDFGRGLALLEHRGLVYDLLVYPRQLSAAIELARRHPRQTFVLDHLAKPEAAQRRREPWASQLRELAGCSNVSCKLSGLVTEADWARWSPRDLTPYLDAALDAFGVERVLFGSDWPVCTLAASYERWFEVLDGWSWMLSPGERAALFGGNASRLYHLDAPRA